MIWTGEGDCSVRSCCPPLLEQSPMELYGNTVRRTGFNFTHAGNLYITREHIKT